MGDRIDELLDKLKTADRGVIRASVIDELTQSRDPKVLRPLVEALNDNETLVRWNAIKALGNFGDDAGRLLLKMLNTEDRYMRRNIIQALGEIGGDAVTDQLIRMLMFDESDTNVLIEIIRALHKLQPDRAVEPLITILKSRDWEMKWRAIHTLGKIGNPRAIEPLLEMMDDPDPDIRWAANAAVENIKNASEAESATADNVASVSPPKKLPAIPDRPPDKIKGPKKELALTTSVDGKKTIVHVDGDLTTENVGAFNGFIDGVISMTSNPVTIDLKNCSFIDSYALGALNNSRKKLKARKLNLYLTGLTPQVKRVFIATKLDSLFDIK